MAWDRQLNFRIRLQCTGCNCDSSCAQDPYSGETNFSPNCRNYECDCHTRGTGVFAVRDFRGK